MKYSIGLDIGIASVGWACMTHDYRIPKFNGKYAMGVREFEAANTAEERRIQRGTRRRYNRRIKRIQLLQRTLAPLYLNDPDFFYINNEQEKHFWRNSNEFENHSLSETLTYLGENKRKYPTIYHLREALIKENKPFHPRLIYLALHHLTKFRGHFLNENMSWNSHENSNDLVSNLENYFEILKEKLDYPEVTLTDDVLNKIVIILEDKDSTNSDKRRDIQKLLHKDYKDAISLLVGLNANAHQLFANSPQAEIYQEEKVKLDLTKDSFVESYEKLLEDEQIIVDQAHVIYQEIILKDLLGETAYVAEAKVSSYNQFRKDLTELQEIYNTYFDEATYRKMFITSSKNKTIYKNTRDEKVLCEFDQFLKVKSKYEDKFYNNLKKKLEKLVKDNHIKSEKITNVINRLDKNQFLQKQKGQMNAAIPHQNNVYEAVTILKNQQKHYPEITNEMIQRVEDIISFRIPYYVGPLVKEDNKGEFGWLKRKDNTAILPWNFDEVVDRSASAEEFINRMTGMCTYLLNEKVLPKHSLMYEKFEVLNELNGIQIRSEAEPKHNDYRLDSEVKAWLLENVFMNTKSVTHKRVIDALKNKYPGIVYDPNTGEIRGIYGTQDENRFSTNLSSHIDMKQIFGKISQENYKMFEELIYWISVFEDKDIIELKVKEKYPHITNQQIKQLQAKSYAGWGRVSRKLLGEMPIDSVKKLTYLEIMENEPKVFMEILHEEKYDLKDRIAIMNQTSDKEKMKIHYRDIESLHGSPAIKKGIWQAIRIVEELVDIYGEPEHIMLEFAREDQVSKRTKSRKKQLEDIHKNISNTEKELKRFLKDQLSREEAEYKDPRLYLYITQEGKCLYSGESLKINQLHTYEVDHILPQSFVKDDSYHNLALVTKEMNQKKSGTKMPLEIINSSQKANQMRQWEKLLKHNLISRQKYSRLLKESFSDQDKESFFARQLVETRQITKHVKDLLDERFKDTEVHTVNANLVTNLRKNSGAYKIREMNNKHHAVDAAFTNLIVQFIINTYGSNFLNFNFKHQEARQKWRDMIFKYKKNFFLFEKIKESSDFKHYQTNEVLTGKEYLKLINDVMPWQTTKKIGSGEAAFYKETLYSPKVKVAKYDSPKLSKGVYDEVKTHSSYLISYKDKNKKGKEKNYSLIVDLTVIENYQTKGFTDKEKAIFLAKKVAKNEVIDAVIHQKILKYQTVINNNHKFNYVSSREMHNGKQLVLNQAILQKLYKTIDKPQDLNQEMYQSLYKEITETIINNYSEIITDNNINKIKESVEKIDGKETFNDLLEELFKLTSASATRSTMFGGRYVKKPKIDQLKFVNESTTGLRYRKPKSYKNELWSK